jgi:hypothetical protein
LYIQSNTNGETCPERINVENALDAQEEYARVQKDAV